ncbi:hypothetical protein C922_04000 [Plasmodium inui San Antonio 1]|uniref:Uncharacterized protein n=1 Tax=Plasmodium inui San Antonio 1 TaxID=1237626 RepID=W7AJI5_9APIC|nr:hypothetical protein C922_04000 [Plasmodium inui San Antonio 1]EUD65496.1 hypothetical protein C922_04000 [Plasmodium inui San Antonio 1]
MHTYKPTLNLLQRKRCHRLNRKHEAREPLLKFLEEVNRKMKEDANMMKKKLEVVDLKIRKEENELEKKWEKKKTTRGQTSQKTKGRCFPWCRSILQHRQKAFGN